MMKPSVSFNMLRISLSIGPGVKNTIYLIISDFVFMH